MTRPTHTQIEAQRKLALDIARRMVAQGAPIREIVARTGLNAEQIRAVQK